MQPHKLYIWARNGNFEVVKLNDKHDGFVVMSNDFPSRDEWWFEDELIGYLYGPVMIGENDKLSD